MFENSLQDYFFFCVQKFMNVLFDRRKNTSSIELFRCIWQPSLSRCCTHAVCKSFKIFAKCDVHLHDKLVVISFIFIRYHPGERDVTSEFLLAVPCPRPGASQFLRTITGSQPVPCPSPEASYILPCQTRWCKPYVSWPTFFVPWAKSDCVLDLN